MMKLLICFCAPLGIFYVVHQIQYANIMWLALTLRGEDTRIKCVGIAALAWLELLSFAIATSYLVFQLF